MISLALDTTTDRLTLALARLGEPVLERKLDGARRHAAALLPLIEALLHQAGIGFGEVERIAMADGPGGFTGIRVAAALVKALARARPGLEVWSASTLMVRAAAVAPPGGARVLVATSALRGELYAAVYRMALPISVRTEMAPVIATVESLHRIGPDLIVADAPDRLVERLADQYAVPLVRGGASLPQAIRLLTLLDAEGGAVRIEKLDDWEPNYGRPAEAQARWEAAHGRALSDPASGAR
jgi:tRNA threonylcarbamoyladenosine biosynthesis protein TsaB